MRNRPALFILPLVAILIAGCGDVPPLDPGVGDSTRSAAYPDLIPAEEITGQVASDAIAPETADDLDSRSAGLRARAARLKGGVIDPTTHNRMQTGVSD